MKFDDIECIFYLDDSINQDKDYINHIIIGVQSRKYDRGIIASLELTKKDKSKLINYYTVMCQEIKQHIQFFDATDKYIDKLIKEQENELTSSK